jgi:hypothetical protein
MFDHSSMMFPKTAHFSGRVVHDISLETDNLSLRLYDPTTTNGRLINFYADGANGELHIFARQSV